MRPMTRRLSICSKGFFFSDLCKDKRSGSQLFTCSKCLFPSSDYLWKSLAEDVIPQSEDVLEDFGFNNVLFGRDRTYLLGVYGGLYFPASSQRRTYISGVLGPSWSIRSRSSIIALLRIPGGNTFPGF